jgi:hypothetical protein
MSAKLKIVSWVLLTIVGSLTLLGSLGSVYVAYVADAKIDQIGPMNLSELAEGRKDLEIALRARRATAAAFATGYSLLFLTIVLVPYRRGDVWAWWTLLVGTLATTGIILMRISVLGTNLGLGAATIPLAVGVVALLLDAGRLRPES